ncbi:MAG: flagellar basal body-associated FliL family protein [Deltaproteobacteria bacterium]|nr:flagellar basal body-associated FliL family protein [Deltaproteobacteria bacterium]
MADEEQEEQTNVTAAAPAPSGGGKLVMVSTLVNMVATIGIVVMLVLAHRKEASSPSVEDIAAGKPAKSHGGGEGAKEESLVDSGKIIPLDQFTVNLSSGTGTMPRYIRINISVELEQNAPEEEFKIKTPRVRDTVISLLNSKKPGDISAVEGREALKDELKRAINGYMTQSKVKSIYFTNFGISN